LKKPIKSTFPQTQTIIDGAVVGGISVDDIQTVLNLRDGWKFIINSIDAPLISQGLIPRSSAAQTNF